MWRKVPIDAIAFVVIAAMIFVTQLPFVRHGMCFNDPSWYFHFGRRVLYGDVPYRDFVFQVGPLPIWVDAGFQKVFGSAYIASLYAGLFTRALRVFVIWGFARRLVSWPVAALLAVWCTFDTLFGFAHNWSLPYAQLFMTVSGYCLWQASRSDGRRALFYLALGGLSAALVFSARQSSAVMIALALGVTTTIMLVRKEYFTPRRYAVLWAGFVAGLALFFGALALQGALGAAVQQMFLDAPSKKGVSGIAAALDAISGGALVDPNMSWSRGLFTYLGLPIAIVGVVLWLAAHESELSARTIAILAVPGAVVIGLLMRHATPSLISDLPRTFFTVVTAMAVLAPARLRVWFGVEPLALIGIATIPLASDWALEMSFPGRGWGDAPSLATGTILLALATQRLTARVKLALCALLAAFSIIVIAICVQFDVSPFTKEEARDGTLSENHWSLPDPILQGIEINDSRKAAIEWLRSRVAPGSTCFVYGNMPVLYDVLQCTNPTLIDSTTGDFIAVGDAEKALAALRAHPPDYLVAHDTTWMNPPLSVDLHGDIAAYGGMNPKTSMALHVGLRALLDQYEHVGTVSDAIGPELSKQAALHWDLLQDIHVYRRKR